MHVLAGCFLSDTLFANLTYPFNKNQRTDSPKSLLACKVLMECCVSSMQFYTIHAKKIDDIPMLPILYDKMELYGIYQASGHCTS